MPVISPQDPDIRLLCQVLRGEAQQVAWAALTAADWKRLLQTAHLHGVAPLCYWSLKKEGWPDTVPDQARQFLEDAYIRTLARNTRMYQELARILQAIQQASPHEPIPVVVLKGAALANTVYPDIGLRPMLDVDVLVPPENLVTVSQALGYLHYIKQQAINHLIFCDYQNDILIEIHWSLMYGDMRGTPRLLDWFWAQTEQWNIQQKTTEPATGLIMTAMGQLLYLMGHMMVKHSATDRRLIWLFDLHLLLEQWRDTLDWDELLDQARAFSCLPALQQALGSMQACLGTDLPQEATHALAMGRSGSTYYLGHCTLEDRITPTQHALDALSSLDWRTRFYLLSMIIFPSRSYLQTRYALKLPEWLWLLYYPYRWFDLSRDVLRTLFSLLRRRL